MIANIQTTSNNTSSNKKTSTNRKAWYEYWYWKLLAYYIKNNIMFYHFFFFFPPFFFFFPPFLSTILLGTLSPLSFGSTTWYVNLLINSSGLIFLSYSRTWGVIAGIQFKSMNFNVYTYLMIISTEYSVIPSHFVSSKCSRTWLLVQSFRTAWSES